jgi:2-dehydro-3-deoxyphosphogluconate aldolase / (4S)-4-hydroxy-2-oxoglutarate aldolase
MTKAEIIQRIIEPGVVGIFRASSADEFFRASEALIAGGVTAVEITMTTPNALLVIREAKKNFGNRALIGVGTVTDERTANAAIEAGAEFVVTPIFRPEVIAACNRAQKPIMSGAYTPTEAFNATEAGADFIKIFPADNLGPSYVKAIRAPLPHLKIVPTGGVDVKTCGEFIKAGCVAVGAGSTLFDKEILQKRDWTALTDLAAAFVRSIKDARAGLKQG